MWDGDEADEEDMNIPGKLRREINFRIVKPWTCSICGAGKYVGGKFECLEYPEILFSMNDEHRYVCGHWRER